MNENSAPILKITQKPNSVLHYVRTQLEKGIHGPENCPHQKLNLPGP